MLDAMTTTTIKTKTYKYKNVELSEKLSKQIFRTNGVLLLNFVIDRIKVYDSNLLYFYFTIYDGYIHYVIENKNCKITEEGKFENDMVNSTYIIDVKAVYNHLSTIY